MRKYLTLIVGLCFAPMAASAQFVAPGYSFGSNGFGNPFGGYMPGFNNMNGPGFPAMNSFGPPGGFSGFNQNPFMTLPPPQYYNIPPNYPRTAAPTQPMAQPSPYWMQTPPDAQPPVLNYSETARSRQPVASAPTNSIFAPLAFSADSATSNTPPRWAPRSDQIPPQIQTRRPSNIWSISPVPQGGNGYAPVIAGTPPKWPTP